MESHESWLALIPRDLLRKARALSLLGVHGFGWNKEDALSVVDILSANGCAVLGGDVLEVKDDSVRHTYDNWYADKSAKEASDWDGIVRVSCAVAEEYISGYVEGKRQILYCLVCADSGRYGDIRRQKKELRMD